MTGKRAQTSPAGSPSSGNLSDGGGGAPNKDQDRLLPIANVSRIMKKSLPANAKISKEAKETVQECVSEFISFVTGEASDKCQREKRKTINGDDLLWAMTTLGFDNYVGTLKGYLHRYRETEGEKSFAARQEEHAPPHRAHAPADHHGFYVDCGEGAVGFYGGGGGVERVGLGRGVGGSRGGVECVNSMDHAPPHRSHAPVDHHRFFVVDDGDVGIYGGGGGAEHVGLGRGGGEDNVHRGVEW